MGIGLRPTAKAVDQPPNPTVRAPSLYSTKVGSRFFELLRELSP